MRVGLRRLGIQFMIRLAWARIALGHIPVGPGTGASLERRRQRGERTAGHRSLRKWTDRLEKHDAWYRGNGERP